MIASSPVFARGTPPDTGASIRSAPNSRTRSASSCVTVGSPELISMTTAPGRNPAISVSSPVASTWRTMALVGSMVMTTSDFAARSRRLSGAKPPTCWTKLSATSRRASLTLSVKPARCRHAAIGQPMLPTPTKPTLGFPGGLSAMLLGGLRLLGVDLLEHLRGGLEGIEAGRNAAIDPRLQQDLLDLVARHAVGQRAAYVQ